MRSLNPIPQTTTPMQIKVRIFALGHTPGVIEAIQGVGSSVATPKTLSPNPEQAKVRVPPDPFLLLHFSRAKSSVMQKSMSFEHEPSFEPPGP